MHFRSLSDLQRSILGNLHRIPSDVDLVVGIPRSGMLPATMLGLALNIQIADLEGFCSRRVMSSGRTRRRDRDLEFGAVKHALIIDDSIDTGGSMAEAREIVERANLATKVTYAAVYGASDTEATDLILEKVRKPRIFEWNVLHHTMLSCACVDIDGVLCHDPSPDENDDGEAYINFIRTARPLFTPTKRIETLVTSRLEKYRSQTEDWLKGRGIEYDRLIMLDLPDAETRRRMGAHGSFKGQYYKSQPHSRLFIESELGQAREIARISGKPVLCMDGPVMCYPNYLTPRGFSQRARQSNRIRRFAQRVFGPRLYQAVVRRFGRRS